MTNFTRRAGALSLGLAALATFGVQAQTSWPARPVRLVVPYSAGGTTDYAARQIAQRLTEQTGKSFFVDNKAGGAGTIGTQDVARSTPDGTTFLISDTTFAILPSLFQKLPFNPKSDFVPVTNIIETPVVLIVPASSPFNSLGELVSYAKANPGKLNVGSGGNGSSTHLSAEVFREATGVQLTHIPYKGAGAALADVMAGQIDILVTAAPTAVPVVKGGKVRALAVTGNTKLRALPNTPTFAEAGLPGFKVVNWFGITAPKATPKPILDKLHAEVVKALADPKLREMFEEQGALPGGMTAAKFDAYVQEEMASWATVVRRANVKAD